MFLDQRQPTLYKMCYSCSRVFKLFCIFKAFSSYLYVIFVLHSEDKTLIIIHLVLSVFTSAVMLLLASNRTLLLFVIYNELAG